MDVDAVHNKVTIRQNPEDVKYWEGTKRGIMFYK